MTFIGMLNFSQCVIWKLRVNNTVISCDFDVLVFYYILVRGGGDCSLFSLFLSLKRLPISFLILEVKLTKEWTSSPGGRCIRLEVCVLHGPFTPF